MIDQRMQSFLFIISFCWRKSISVIKQIENSFIENSILLSKLHVIGICKKNLNEFNADPCVNVIIESLK